MAASLSISSSKTFVVAFAAVVGTMLVGFGVASEWLVRTHVIPSHNEYRYAALFQKSSASNAIFGDSHAAYGLTGIDSFVNVAHGGNNFRTISGKVRLYFAERKPGKVILQAGAHHFSRDFTRWRDDETPEFESFLRGYAAYYPRALIPLHRKELLNYWSTYWRGRSFTPLQQFMPDGSQLSMTALYTDTPLPIRRSASVRSARILEPVEKFESSETAREYREIIAFLQERGGTVCLVTLPVATLLRREFQHLERFAAAQHFFSQLAQAANIPYVNLLGSEYPDEYFADAHHLNATGARSISGDVARRCFQGSGSVGTAYDKRMTERDHT